MLRLFWGLAMLACLVCQANSWRDIYVDNSFEGQGRGTAEAPYQTVQEALADSLAATPTFSADVIWIRGTGRPYFGPVEVPNRNALLFRGYGEQRPELTITGLVAATTIKSGDDYASPFYACMPPAQVGLENLRISNASQDRSGRWYAADIQAFVSWEASVTNNPAHMRFGIRDCEFAAAGSNGCLRLRDLDQRHKEELVAAGHWSLVERCIFAGEADLLTLASQQRAALTSNVFLGGRRAIFCEGWTNGVYQRLTEQVRIRCNRFYNQAEAVLFGGVYPEFLFARNTCVAGEAGLHLGFLRDNMEPRGEVTVAGNIFCGGSAAAAYACPEWADSVLFGENLFDGLPGTGEGALAGEAQFLSLDPGSPDFLRPAETSAANLEDRYLGALAPVPEPGLLWLLGMAFLGAVRAREAF